MAVAGLATGATPEVTYDASLRTELRAGSGLGVVVNGAAGGSEIAVIPSLTLHVDTGRRSSVLAPIRPPAACCRSTTTGTGHSWPCSASRGSRAGANAVSGEPESRSPEDFQYGTTDFFAAVTHIGLIGHASVLQPLFAAFTSLLYVFSNSQATLALRLSSDLAAVRSPLATIINGGADAVAQLSLPLQRGPYRLGWPCRRGFPSSMTWKRASCSMAAASPPARPTSLERSPRAGYAAGLTTGGRISLPGRVVCWVPLRGAPYTPSGLSGPSGDGARAASDVSQDAPSLRNVLLELAPSRGSTDR